MLGTVAGVAHMQVLQESARTLSTATLHAQKLIEAIRLEANASLDSAISQDWTQWAGTNGLDTLDDEAAAVMFATQAEDLEEACITINWKVRQHPMTYEVTTLLTEH